VAFSGALMVGFSFSPVLAVEQLLDELGQSCLASFSENAGILSVPCLRVTSDDEPNLSYSATLQKMKEGFAFSLSTIEQNADTKEMTACDAVYDAESKTVRIPCLSSDGNTQTVHAVYLHHDDEKQVFDLLDSRNGMERMSRRWVNTVTLPDTATAWNPRYGVCRSVNISMSGTVNAKIYSVTGEYYSLKPTSTPYYLSLYRDDFWSNPLIATKEGISYDFGNTKNFKPFAANLPSGDYYWCISGFPLYKATVTLSK